MTVAVVVLAGGEGRRIGGAKPLRLLCGRTLLDRALGQARQWSEIAAVAVRDQAQLGGADAQAIVDDREVEGPLGGLAAALRFARVARVEAVLTIPADMPFLPPDLLDRLEQSLGDGSAALAASGGSLHPVCGLWRVRALEALPGFVATGKRSLRAFAESMGMAVADWPSEPLDPFFNINKAKDLAAAERLLEG